MTKYHNALNNVSQSDIASQKSFLTLAYHSQSTLCTIPRQLKWATSRLVTILLYTGFTITFGSHTPFSFSRKIREWTMYSPTTTELGHMDSLRPRAVTIRTETLNSLFTFSQTPHLPGLSRSTVFLPFFIQGVLTPVT